MPKLCMLLKSGNIIHADLMLIWSLQDVSMPFIPVTLLIYFSTFWAPTLFLMHLDWNSKLTCGLLDRVRRSSECDHLLLAWSWAVFCGHLLFVLIILILL